MQTLLFADDDDIPNSRLPLIVYRQAVNPSGDDPAAAFETLFTAHGWRGCWRNGIFPFHHYHSTAHEVLGIARGQADVRFGGAAGQTLSVAAGDAVLVPAGVGHKRVSSSPDLLVIGAYPSGQSADLLREGVEDGAAVRRRVAAVGLPDMDPVEGRAGPMHTQWR